MLLPGYSRPGIPAAPGSMCVVLAAYQPEYPVSVMTDEVLYDRIFIRSRAWGGGGEGVTQQNSVFKRELWSVRHKSGVCVMVYMLEWNNKHWYVCESLVSLTDQNYCYLVTPLNIGYYYYYYYLPSQWHWVAPRVPVLVPGVLQPATPVCQVDEAGPSNTLPGFL